jgi:transposase-like protein
MQLACPHCKAPVKANPIGRWFARFQCPHCKRMLQWSSLTNTLGIGGSLLFFVAAYAAVMGKQPWTQALAAGAAVLWVAAVGLSYALRRIEKA